jgi:threonyl-tRNA synthetase
VWLAPTQVAVLPIVTDAVGYAAGLRDALRASGMRADLDDRDATLAARVRDAQQSRVPYVAVVGRREANDGTVSVRLRDGQQLLPMTTSAFVTLVGEAVATRRLG